MASRATAATEEREIYLEEGRSLVAAARRLGIHENTVKYRLRRCEELLGRPPADRPLRLQAAILLAICLLFVPAYTSIRLAFERDTNVDLLFVTTIKPSAIVWGKMFAALTITVLIFSACMPFMVFTYWLRVLPAFGAAGMDADFLSGWARIADQLRHLALPLLTLTLIGVGGTARFARGAILDVLAQPFVAAARAKGVSESRVLARHVLRNALGPMLILLGLSLPALFSGAVLVETVFAWPGVGRVMVEAVQSRDYPVVMAATAVSALLVVVGNILADVLAAWADPRVRGAAREA